MSVLLSGLLERLNLSRDEGEKWIVNLILETRMGTNAKIDLEKVHSSSPFSFRQVNMALTPQNVIEIYCPLQPVYQSVIEKTRGLALRTQAIGAAIARAGGPIAVEPLPSQVQVVQE